MGTNAEFLQLPQTLYENAIGRAVLEWMGEISPVQLKDLANLEALEILSQIISVVNDPSLSDGECFQQISAIVQLLSDHSIPVTRHQEME